MVDRPQKPPGHLRRAERQARLAEALRANLRRRKAQARARAARATPPEPPNEPPAKG